MTSHNMCVDDYVNTEVCRLCGCGRAVRPHTFFCGDECRFWSKVQKGPGCWLWQAGLHTEGYGQFSTNVDGKRRPIGAHVFAYQLVHGPIPEGAFVLHHCDTPRCVRQEHLFLGDQLANMQDAAKKGRLHVPRPKRQRLSVDDVYAIRGRVASGETYIRVAADYRISKTLVSLLVSGKRRQYDAPLRPSLEQAS